MSFFPSALPCCSFWHFCIAALLSTQPRPSFSSLFLPSCHCLSSVSAFSPGPVRSQHPQREESLAGPSFSKMRRGTSLNEWVCMEWSLCHSSPLQPSYPWVQNQALWPFGAMDSSLLHNESLWFLKWCVWISSINYTSSLTTFILICFFFFFFYHFLPFASF